MDFIGAANGAGGRIPAPNINLSPEMLCKNYPFEFLVQPIVPLLSPPTSEKPSFCLSIPALKEACLGFAGSFSKPTFQLIGTGILATCVSYVAWKASLKMCEGIFAKESEADIDTDRLDDEVARILSTIPEECTFSTSGSCSNLNSQRDLCHRLSVTSSVTDRLSQESFCSCAAEVGRPLKQLQSCIDQVMSRVEVVISSLKVLEENMSSPIKEGERGNGGDSGADGVPSTNEAKKDVFEISLPEKILDKDTVHLTQAPDSNLLTKQKSPLKLRLATDEPEEDFGSIHKRIMDLEKRVENIKSNSQEKKTSPCESILSSFCSDRWDKSSSVSIISEQDNQEIGNSASSPRSLPITVHSLISPCHDQLTPPSDHKRLTNFKNVKRYARSRPIHFPQFPTIEEDPLSYAESASDHKSEKEHGSLRVPDGEMPFDREWDSIGDTEYQANRYSGVKRQMTWPRLYSQHKNVEPHFYVPKINTFKCQFKQSENSCFEARKPVFNNTERSYCQNTGMFEASFSVPVKSQNSPRSGISRTDKFQLRSKDFCFDPKSPDTPVSFPPKPQNSPRHAIFRTENMHLKSGDFGVGSISPAKYNADSINVLAKTTGGPETPERKAEETLKAGIEKINLQLSSSKTPTSIRDVHDDIAELKAPKHKLVTCEVDAPPRKLCRGDLDTSASSQSTSATNNGNPQTKVEAVEGKSTSTPPSSSDRLRRISPFKRGGKRNNSFQVKFVSKKGSEDVDSVSSVGQGDKEDEWIVIVPNDKS